jgi:hypothetical protein
LRHSAVRLALGWVSAVAVCLIGVGAAEARNGQSFVLSDADATTAILVDAGDADVVRIAADMLAGDIETVVSRRPAVVANVPASGTVVVAGTLGKSRLLDDLVARKHISTQGVKGAWEAYRLEVVDHPWPGVAKALVVLGADRRGTAYGLLSLSRQLGISPWVWWSDVTPRTRAQAVVTVDDTVAQPSVRYRGIFINDEDWSLRPWAATNLEPERANIGPKTYERVFALMLRLRANTLWPAMHPGTLAFNQDARNAALADRYAIVMGASHAEPMLRNNVAEWDVSTRGEFDFASNRQAVARYWDERVQANGRYENLYTVGMRGIHDTPVQAGEKIDRVKLLEDVVATQRDMIAKHVSANVAQVPQVFVPYKEVLDIYRRNMKLPDDVTLGWVDDNFGYIRQLSTAAEQKRSGGAGVYYHVSYWGAPTSYLWITTTPPALIASEMGRAWDTGARRMWILNVGDIKPAEVDTEYFLDLAWDYAGTHKLGQSGYLRNWAAATFGAQHADAIAALLAEHDRLGFIRKPEHMDFAHDDVGVQTTQFSPVAYGDEAGRRLADYERLLDKATALEQQIPADLRDAYYELVLYPITGARWMAEKALMADRSFLAAWQGRASAGLYAARSAAALQAIHQATARYNATAHGKWRNFMDDAPRDQPVFGGLPTGSAIPSSEPSLGVAVEGSVDALVRNPAKAGADYADRVGRWRSPASKPDELPAFSRATRVPHFLDLFNTGGGSVAFKLTPSVSWVSLSEAQGTLGADKRVWASIDWAHVPQGTREAAIAVEGGGQSYTVRVRLDDEPLDMASAGTFVAASGLVSIEAEHFTRKVDAKDGGWVVTPDLGRVGAAIETKASLPSRDTVAGAPYVDYDFVTSHQGAATLTLAALPTFPIDREHKLRYAVAVDDAAPKIIDLDEGRVWEQDVVRNARYSSSDWTLRAGPRHVIRLWALDPALVIDRLELDLGGKQTSYLGSGETVLQTAPAAKAGGSD